MALDSFIVVPPDDPRWQAAFDRLPPERQDVFWTPAYARLMQETIYRGHLVLAAIGDGTALAPFVLRKLEKLVGPVARGLTDITGLYGRNGIVGWCATDMFAEMAAFAAEARAICDFARIHPLWLIPGHAGEFRKTGHFIALDLAPPIEEIERAYAHSLRKEIAKAERAGVASIEMSAPGVCSAIYAETMMRNSAPQFYRFGADFFGKARATLGGSALFFFASTAGRDNVLSAELVLVHGLYAHSFLGGTTAEGLKLSANHLLKRDLIRELKRRGCRWYLLGGGAKPGDGIEAYKRQFAPNGVYPSRILCRVFDRERYDGLKADMLAAGLPVREDRFQFYDPN